jgi:hypothetical protein
MIEPSRIQQQGNSFNANEAFPKVCNSKTANEAFPKVCNSKTEIGKFLEEKYQRYQKVKDLSFRTRYQ